MNGKLCEVYCGQSCLSGNCVRQMINKCASKAILWIGMGMIAVLAIPAGIIFLLIRCIWMAVDEITALLNKKAEQ